MKKLLSALAVAPLAITACGGGTKALKPKSVMTIVAEGTVTDGTFNQSVDKGAKEVQSSLGLTVGSVEADTKDAEKLKTAIVGQIEQGVETLLLPGFNHGTKQLEDLAKVSTDRNFIIFDANGWNDASFNFTAFNSPRIASVLYEVQQAAYLAGYFTAKYYDSEGVALKFASYGGMKIPSVYSFMAGAAEGVERFKQESTSGLDHKVITLPGGADKQYSGSFKAGEGTTISNELIDAGANVIMPVAGPQTKDTIDAIKAKGKTAADIQVIGVDVDATGLYTADAGFILTSVLKKLQASTARILRELYEGTPDRSSFRTTTKGTLDSKEIDIVYNTKIKKAWIDDATKGPDILARAKNATKNDSRYA